MNHSCAALDGTTYSACEPHNLSMAVAHAADAVKGTIDARPVVPTKVAHLERTHEAVDEISINLETSAAHVDGPEKSSRYFHCGINCGSLAMSLTCVQKSMEIHLRKFLPRSVLDRYEVQI